MYFITDVLDSKHKYIHNDIAHPTYQRPNNEKFPHIEVPKAYWKVWSDIIKTLHSSLRVSGFYPGRCIQKHKVLWLQKNDRTQLLQRISPYVYRVYALKSSTRRIWKYHRYIFHETMFESLADFQHVTVQTQENIILTDGFDETIISALSRARLQLPLHKRTQDFKQWVLAQINYKPTQKKQTSWDVFISDKVKSKLPNEEIEDFLSAVEQLHPTLRRNIGGIQEVEGLSELAEAIIMDNVMAVSDASLGSRNRAAHAYIIESRCEKFKIIGVAPVDCDPDDLKSTRAELWGQLAIHTVINVLVDLFNIRKGSIDIYGDNKDSLVLQKIR